MALLHWAQSIVAFGPVQSQGPAKVLGPPGRRPVASKTGKLCSRQRRWRLQLTLGSGRWQDVQQGDPKQHGNEGIQFWGLQRMEAHWGKPYMAARV
jgi:hypothetical protein